SPMTRVRHPDPIVVTRHRREVAGGDDSRCRRSRTPHQHHHALLGVAGVDPREAGWIAVQFMKRRVGAYEMIEIAYPALHALMPGVGQEMPVEALVVIPLAPLAELPSHEQQLLPR